MVWTPQQVVGAVTAATTNTPSVLSRVVETTQPLDGTFNAALYLAVQAESVYRWHKSPEDSNHEPKTLSIVADWPGNLLHRTVASNVHNEWRHDATRCPNCIP